MDPQEDIQADIEELVKAAQQGHTTAQEELYAMHVRLLFGYLYNTLGSRADAEDICQETFLKAFKNIRSFKGQASFKNWLFQIAKNTVADHWRSRYKANTILVDDFYEFAEAPAYELPEESAENTATQSRETEIQLDQILNQLSQDYREVLEYRFLKGYTIQETADALHISVANAKVRQLRALRKAKSIHSPL